jgi:hypothetical protein
MASPLIPIHSAKCANVLFFGTTRSACGSTPAYGSKEGASRLLFAARSPGAKAQGY